MNVKENGCVGTYLYLKYQNRRADYVKIFLP